MTSVLDGIPTSTASVTNPASSVPTVSSFSIDFSSVLSDISSVIEKKLSSISDNLKDFLSEDTTMNALFYSVLLFSLIPIGIYLTLIFIFLQYSSVNKIILLIIFTILLYRIVIIINKLKKKITGSKMIHTNSLRKKVRNISEKVTNIIIKIVIPVLSTIVSILFLFYISKYYWQIKHSKEYKELNHHSFFNILNDLITPQKKDKNQKFLRLLFQDYSFNGSLNSKLQVLLNEIKTIKSDIETIKTDINAINNNKD